MDVQDIAPAWISLSLSLSLSLSFCFSWQTFKQNVSAHTNSIKALTLQIFYVKTFIGIQTVPNKENHSYLLLYINK